ncbi:formyltetrahydrofolate deformylase [Lihuaxuella thermophila]|uniref:Formyltetrahydrofolate deformylase n=1 Tax=Lihuaxuella thermophila TaxID=1173111 RepID=A0A1H8FST2_9BACL|nr:formyltetrahydrofolate deformylase [Lihuaxuella thermophila]SEN34620.1 formyltetrahydrofolate deformylase [Lihuaxuella thermophila]
MKIHTHGKDLGRLLICCADQPGIIAAVSRFLFEQGANIVDSDQYTTDPHGGFFFMRVEFQLEELIPRLEPLRERFARIAVSFDMEWRITPAARKQRVAVFVSREDHCLREILWRWNIGELHADISMVISNHPDMEAIVAPFGIPYHHVPVSKESREQAADIHLELLNQAGIDTIILARYMQIIPARIIDRYRNQIINIHHSFLPAFVGGKPYHQAYERGVKIIGATAHYVTEELDQGPIIEQDVQRVSHRHHVEDLKRIGRDLERIVLARAVQWHLNDQVLVHGNKTIVFP